MKLTKSQIKELIRHSIRELTSEREDVTESKKRRFTVKEVRMWMKKLEENRYKKVYNSDARRVAWMVNNEGRTLDEMPISMKKKWTKAQYGRERYLATEFLKSKSEQMTEGKLTEDKFIAFYKKDRVTVNAKSLWDAKKQIIAKLKVPKKDVGLVSVLNKTEYDKQKFRFEGKLTEVKEPLWDKDSVKNVIKQIQKGIKVPYADGLGLGALSRRDEHPAIMGKISVDDKKTWPNGYLENSRWALVRIEADGTIDTVRMNGYGDFKTRKKVPILRKSKNKSIKQIIDRLGKYFTVVRLKYPDNK